MDRNTKTGSEMSEGEIKTDINRARPRRKPSPSSSYSSGRSNRSRSNARRPSKRVGIDERDSTSIHPEEIYKTKLCEFFPKCPDGNNCRFAHGIEELRMNKSRYKTAMCNRLPNCRAGSRCNFAHEQSELRRNFDQNGSRYGQRKFSYQTKRSRSLSPRRSKSPHPARQRDGSSNSRSPRTNYRRPAFKVKDHKVSRRFSKSSSRRSSSREDRRRKPLHRRAQDGETGGRRERDGGDERGKPSDWKETSHMEDGPDKAKPADARKDVAKPVRYIYTGEENAAEKTANNGSENGVQGGHHEEDGKAGLNDKEKTLIEMRRKALKNSIANKQKLREEESGEKARQAAREETTREGRGKDGTPAFGKEADSYSSSSESDQDIQRLCGVEEPSFVEKVAERASAIEKTRKQPGLPIKILFKEGAEGSVDSVVGVADREEKAGGVTTLLHSSYEATEEVVRIDLSEERAATAGDRGVGRESVAAERVGEERARPAGEKDDIEAIKREKYEFAKETASFGIKRRKLAVDSASGGGRVAEAGGTAENRAREELRVENIKLGGLITGFKDKLEKSDIELALYKEKFEEMAKKVSQSENELFAMKRKLVNLKTDSLLHLNRMKGIHEQYKAEIADQFGYIERILEI